MSSSIASATKIHCYHCGEVCNTNEIHVREKAFCCEGCKMVYQVLNEEGLCEYYDLNKNPGITQNRDARKDKFAFLDDSAIESKLISFKNEQQVHVTLYLPQIHCSSCLYLLENLHRLNDGIISSRVDFTGKQVTIVYLAKKTIPVIESKYPAPVPDNTSHALRTKVIIMANAIGASIFRNR